MQDVYRWVDGKKVAVGLSFDFDAETPFLWRNRAKSTTSMGEIEQRRFGPRQGVYRILDLLDSHHIRATFYVPGRVAELYPEPVKEIAKQGHEIGLHGYMHERVDEIDEGTLRDTIVRSKQILEDLTGCSITGYRSPSWEMTPLVFQLLSEYGISYDSSLMGYDHPYTVDGVAEVPVQWLLDDAIYYRYVGGTGQNPPMAPSMVLDIWNREYDALRKFGGLFLLTMHPWISGRASRIQALDELIQRIKTDEDVWWATCHEIAAYSQDPSE